MTEAELLEAAALLALEMLREDIAAVMPATPEAALVARLCGQPDALALLAALSNRMGDRVAKFAKAHPREFEAARAELRAEGR